MTNRIDYYYFKGKCKWAKLYQPDIKYNNWNIQVYLDRPSIELWNKLKEPVGPNTTGIMNELKRDEDGDYVIFRRPCSRKFKNLEEALAPPLVLDKDNKPTRDVVGNGSDVTVKVIRYTYNKPGKGQGKAIRLETVRIDNLVPYEGSFRGMEDQPVEHSETF